MLTRLSFAVIVAAMVAAGAYEFGRKHGQQQERTTTQIAALKQIERAQEQTSTWKAAHENAVSQYAEAGRALALAASRNSRELGRLRNALASPPTLPPDTPKAVGDAYTGAERDIVDCAAELESLGREAAEAARSARALDASWPVSP